LEDLCFEALRGLASAEKSVFFMFFLFIFYFIYVKLVYSFGILYRIFDFWSIGWCCIFL